MRILEPALKSWLDQFNEALNALKVSGFSPTPETARQGLANLTLTLTPDSPEVAKIIDDEVISQFEVSFSGMSVQGAPSIPIRIYHPSPDTALPVLLYLHGGGHTAGSVTVYDPICRKLAIHTQHIVVSLDYRLAPEYPYPAGLTDCYQVARGIWPLLEKHKVSAVKSLSVAGDSGGGALAASLSQRACNDENLNIDKQILIYPSLDYTMNQPSLIENGTGYLLQTETIAWYFNNYFQHHENREQVSPLWQEIDAGHFPKTLLFTAEFCPLRDEGKAFVDKLEQAGVNIEHHHFDNMIHAFLNMETLTAKACQHVYQQAASFLNDGIT
ncbi:alpha/beta hydrolase [Veronia pacifica]|uniref:Carboxylesterase n=1 Tax=Veronia pacifica TaxID=1080227 RepID=A0A1C3E9K1_9GAMM|nr:alpha/beta hydrolase [Veronia pacifica]ODA29925.1 carboxylesterase [Veronia pacifica]